MCMYLFAHTYKISQLLLCMYVLKDTYTYKHAGSLMLAGRAVGRSAGQRGYSRSPGAGPVSGFVPTGSRVAHASSGPCDFSRSFS